MNDEKWTMVKNKMWVLNIEEDTQNQVKKYIQTLEKMATLTNLEFVAVQCQCCKELVQPKTLKLTATTSLFDAYQVLKSEERKVYFRIEYDANKFEKLQYSCKVKDALELKPLNTCGHSKSLQRPVSPVYNCNKFQCFHILI